MSVSQPFNPDTFNFTKIKDGEILFEMTKGNNSDVQSKGDSSVGHLTNGYHDAVVNNGTDSQCHKKKVRLFSRRCEALPEIFLRVSCLLQLVSSDYGKAVAQW